MSSLISPRKLFLHLQYLTVFHLCLQWILITLLDSYKSESLCSIFQLFKSVILLTPFSLCTIDIIPTGNSFAKGSTKSVFSSWMYNRWCCIYDQKIFWKGKRKRVHHTSLGASHLIIEGGGCELSLHRDKCCGSKFLNLYLKNKQSTLYYKSKMWFFCISNFWLLQTQSLSDHRRLYRQLVHGMKEMCPHQESHLLLCKHAKCL